MKSTRWIRLFCVWLVFCAWDVSEAVHEDIIPSSRNAASFAQKEEDPLELVDLSDTASSIYDTIKIVEKSGEEALGDQYVPYDPSAFRVPKKKGGKSRFRRRFRGRESESKESAISGSVQSIPYVKLEDRWNWTVSYHRRHSYVSDSRLSLRYALLKRCRDAQESIVMDDSTQYLFYWPFKAGIGNTLSALSEVMLLAMYTGRKFLLLDWSIILQYISVPFPDVTAQAKIYANNPQAVISNGKKGCGIDLPSILNGTNPNRFIIIRSSCGIGHEFVHRPLLTKWLVDNGIVGRSPGDALQKYHEILQFLFIDVLHPLPVITDAVAAIEKELMWSQYSYFGIHIRSGLLEGNVGWGRFLEPRDVEYFIAQATKYTPRVERREKKKVKWLVLSDADGVKKEVMEAAKDRYTAVNCTVSHSKDASHEGLKCSIIENYLLSDCSMLFLTAKSTFGYLAKHRTEVAQISVHPGAWKKMWPCLVNTQN